MELVRLERNRSQFFIRDFDARRVWILVQPGAYLEPLPRSGVGDQIDHHFVAAQRLTPPVLADVGEEPMLDLILFAGPRWKVAHRDL